MRSACLAALVLLPAGDDKAAQDLLKAFRERVEKSKALRVEGRLASRDGNETIWDAAVSLRLRGRDRWAIEIRQTKPSSDSVQGGDVSAYCDGRRVFLAAAPPDASLPSLKPEVGSDILRWTVAVGSLSDLENYLGADPNEPLAKPVAPVVADVKDGGTAKVGEVEARIVEYTVRPGGARLAEELSKVRLFIDPASKRLLKKEFDNGAYLLVESYSAFAYDEDLPDADFSFQSPRRLARARAVQLARSVELYGIFTGRHPRSLDDLAARPAHLEAEIFWPDGGFVLGGVVPKDPWGRPYELKLDRAGARILGTGDAREVEVAVPPVTRRAVGAPTERLQKQFTARVQVHLLAAALRAYRDSMGELPRRKAALWEKPGDAPAWPDGGFLPGGRVPLDPWGEPYRIISDPGKVRVQVRDPGTRKLTSKVLDAEEVRRLEEIARPRVTEEERRAVHALLDRLGEDDFDAREKAVTELVGWGPAVLSLLEDRLKTEKDAETRLRVQGIQRAIPARRVAWSRELAPPVVTVGASEVVAGDDALLTACKNNLTQLWSLQHVYRSQFGGRTKAMPDATGKDFWLALARTKPPLVDPSVADILVCPASAKESKDVACTYRGPARSVAKLQDTDVVGMCDDEAHGDVAVVLRKSGEVVVVSRSDGLYQDAFESTQP